MNYYGDSMAKLIEQLSKLPSIGIKTAQRLAFYIIDMPFENVNELAKSIIEAKKNIKYCSVCSTITDNDICNICSNSDRNKNVIMVVENPRDMAAYEKTRNYNGLYHVLHGAISPINGITPSDLKIKELLQRLENTEIEEIIIATNPNVEGEATALYLAKLLKPLGINVSRIANGVPVGGDLEYVDEVTLSRALEGRRPI